MKKKLRILTVFLLRLNVIVIIGFVFLNLIFPLKVSTDYSQSVYSSDGRLMQTFLNNTDKWRIFIPLNNVSPLFVKTIVTKEDKYFYSHFGVNPVAVFKAFFVNTVSSKRLSGASTISMQVARLFQPKKRNVFNKLIEVFRAIQLEIKYSKNEILELYLNHLPYGGNIEGVNSASLIYFNKQASALSLSECVILSVIPNKPTSLNIKNKYSSIVLAKEKWLRIFEKDKVFNENLILTALNEPLDIQKFALPKIAPQFCLRLKNTHKNECNIQSSINSYFQMAIQEKLKKYVEKLKERNINNASVFVLNNQTGKVIVYCGSNDYDDDKHAGQVDGVVAFRSPGSALKPLLYAQSFETGICTPNTILLDVPINIGNYTPVNYDKTYKGTVSLQNALINSLNIPAVEMLKTIGLNPFISFLKQFGFKNIKSKEMGFSLALGACGVSLEELVLAYSVFAKQGELMTPSMLLKPSEMNENRVLSKESAYFISDILQKLNRPDISQSMFNSTFRIPKIAWKTGTSFGRRDAWAIGYNQKYTIGVWVGNFDGEGVPSLNGAESATPLLFDVFNYVDYNSNKQWFNIPKGIKYRLICSKSGFLPSENCSQLINDAYIENITVQQKCQHIIPIMVNMDSTFHYCNSCVDNQPYLLKNYLFLQPNLINFYETEKIAYPKIPPHYSQCTKVYESKGLKIISPNDGSEYLIEKDTKTKLSLNAETDYLSKKIFWYVNNKLVGETLPNIPFFISPPFGNLKIICMDDLARKYEVNISIKEF